jgi:hypothetical protein
LADLNNSLEWTVQLAGGEERSVTVAYKVSYPASEKVDFVERHHH